MKTIILFIIISSFSFPQLFESGSVKYKIQSLILPGLGELKMGHKDKARSFFIREAALWFVYLGGNSAANWYESDYNAFAALHANIDMQGKDYIFAVNMGQYDTMQEYNHAKSQQRQVDKKYVEGEGNEWEWDSTENRIEFDKLRIQSITYEKYASFAIGSLLIHRIISLIDVIYLERNFPQLHLESNVPVNSGSVQLQLKVDF